MKKVASFQKGQDVWYKTRNGTFVEAKVASVDLSLVPVSYGVYLDGSDHLRETESPRLRARDAGQRPPTNGSNSPVRAEDREKPGADRTKMVRDPAKPSTIASADLVSAEEAEGKSTTAKASNPNNEGMDWSATRRRPHTASAVFRTPGFQIEPPGGAAKSHTAKKAFSPPLEEDDDFGDFSEAATIVPNSGHPPAREGPIPLSAFGEAVDEEEDPPSADLATPWMGVGPLAHSRQSGLPERQMASGLPQMPQGWNSNGGGALPQSLHPIIASQLFPARDIMNSAAASVPPIHPVATPAALHSQHAQPQGFSPKSPATQSDDFGDFEEADMAVNENASNNVFSAELTPAFGFQPYSMGQYPLPLQLPTSRSVRPFEVNAQYPEKHTTPKQNTNSRPSLPLQELEQREEADIEAEGDEEIPWYMDAAAFQAAKVDPPMTTVTSPQLLQSFQGVSQMPQSLAPIVSSPADGGSTSVSAEATTDSGRSLHAPAQSVLPGVFFMPAHPAILASDLQQLNPSQGPNLMEVEAEKAPGPSVWAPQNGHAGPVGTQMQAELRQLVDEQRWLLPSYSYLEAWNQMMEVCAAELERGHAILQSEALLPPDQRRLVGPRGKDYLRALGQLYLSSLLLRTAMLTHVQQHHQPPAFHGHYQRCTQAWHQGGGEDSLGEAVFRVAPQMPRHIEQIPRQATHALSEGPRWEQMRQAGSRQWQEGLCGISLLPLEQLEELHIAPWLDDRPCLVLLANLWTHKVNTRAPRLQGWSN